MAGLVELVLRRVRTRLSPPPPEPSFPAIEELAAALEEAYAGFDSTLRSGVQNLLSGVRRRLTDRG